VTITFRRIAQKDLATLRSWFADTDLAERLSYPDDTWFAHLRSDDAACWVASDETGSILAQLQVDRTDASTGDLAFAIRPDLRGKGYGKAVLRAFLARVGRNYVRLAAFIEPDNIASLACVRSCGFEVALSPDEDGMLKATWNRPENHPSG
jgi:RimJ/RimL family protein N-acetyltransferase